LQKKGRKKGEEGVKGEGKMQDQNMGNMQLLLKCQCRGGRQYLGTVLERAGL
jgi:hypothetical protein